MDRYLDNLAARLSARIRENVDLPFYTEEEEELFFRLVVAHCVELAVSDLLELVQAEPAEA
jgi:hypothetical protein